MILRHLAAILMLPTVVTLVVPWSLMRATTTVPRVVALGAGLDLLARAAGGTLAIGGVALVAWCVRLFARELGVTNIVDRQPALTPTAFGLAETARFAAEIEAAV